ncbi:Transcription termination factor mitochondrial/chloroplastic [Arabidopsis suecica]|jgi:mTERF domain-containing protein|uniref:Transcription termination factor MTERF5, chloroplastic n=3 Tax=Arabidopsis TaxID=3701 RepID=MTEF5_ARATH|nr:Mitochondrial transcription termination factor family protein [Arabidopsis thaliana]NP_567435.4 Mitochondrial transcription termination factor family protein [Arabidopsis thaliana]F4JVI3.1 RecName: Full=Transcription termination factor MTERF5, chloroplastic; AltName: Full=Mitochondrial transcription termination factor 5; Short=mTERF5; AltName: Full=Protein MTERF DEFECTIVE IN ARABIDOPSIS 1; Flags: Precursor [Arabidopsis thaliana]KAG7620462.1 Transcription termination factor mitochondrial/chlor|eukprot:NP_001327961.1 Mitochondrial transcription termination factor family protein [Arabidopsis thaliana]
MQSLSQLGPSEIFLVARREKPSTRAQLWFTGRLSFRQETNGIRLKNRVEFSPRPVPPNLIAAEKEEAKAVLTLFFKKQGLSNSLSSRLINKSDLFIDHLVSRLHSVHKARYLVGRELTTLEIRDSLIPYLEQLHEEHGDLLAELVVSFPDPPAEPRLVASSPVSVLPPRGDTDSAADTRKLRAVSRVSELDTEGALRPQTLYLLDLGLNLEQIKTITRKFAAFPYYSLDGKIKPVVEFLLDLGIPKSDIPTILCKRPQICGISLTDNLKPTMAFLETLGIDKNQWAKIISRFPAILTYSRQKLTSTVEFLSQTGLTEEQIGRILTRCPNIMSYSVEDKLRPTMEYFRSLNVDVAVLLHRCPQTFGLSIESNLKPVTEFFLEKGFGLDEIGIMISRYGALYTFSLKENVMPKWDYFQTMDYPKSELVKFPQFFGYSLQERIKPRYELVQRSGVRLLLNQVLSLSGIEFEKVVKKKMMKLVSNNVIAEQSSGGLL